MLNKLSKKFSSVKSFIEKPIAVLNDLGDSIKKKISDAKKGHKMLFHVKEALKLGRIGYKHSKETLERMCKIQNAMPKISCPHCDFVGNAGNVKRWHFDNCKKKGN